MITQAAFSSIQQKAASFPYTALAYTEYDDVASYDWVADTALGVLLRGYDTEARCIQFLWASGTPAFLIDRVQEPSLVPFIPSAWVKELEQHGFAVRNAWHDYFLESLPTVQTEPPLLIKPCDADEAAKLTAACRGDSRGFTGQTADWIAAWLRGEDGVDDPAILGERDANGDLIGLLCTGTYARQDGSGKMVWIRELCVHPRARNRGIGHKLILQALRYGAEHGGSKAFLAADEQNTGAIHLYQSVGFCPGADESQIDMLRL